MIFFLTYRFWSNNLDKFPKLLKIFMYVLIVADCSYPLIFERRSFMSMEQRMSWSWRHICWASSFKWFFRYFLIFDTYSWCIELVFILIFFYFFLKTKNSLWCCSSSRFIISLYRLRLTQLPLSFVRYMRYKVSMNSSSTSGLFAKIGSW